MEILKNKVLINLRPFKFYTFLLLLLLICGKLVLHSSTAVAMDKVYFRTLDGEQFVCSKDNLEYHMDPSGKLASICERLPEVEGQDGATKETAFELDINGKLTKKYVLDLLRRGQVNFKDKTDAENTLSICEDLGLPAIERFICNFIGPKRRPRRELIALGQGAAAQAQARTQSGSCPEGYVLVAGNPDYSTPAPSDNFCVMKYAASNGGNGAAVARQGMTPWVNINRSSAATACAANGPGYHLITNAEWMTIARDIEANPVNWNRGEGPVGTGTLSRGNSNSNAASATSTDDNPYSGTGITNGDWTHKRTHTLSTDEVIWDMAGNVWQWVSDPLTRVGQSQWQEMSILPDANDRLLFGPSGAFTSIHGIGQIVPGSAGAVLRGGAWSHDSAAGVFAAYLNFSAADSNGNVGFRCSVSAAAGSVR